MKPVAIVLLLSIGTFGWCDEPAKTPSLTPDQVKALQLVADLGDLRFKVRENAARELKKLGRSAKFALQEGMKSTDPEVWIRCSQLLPEVMALDLKARVDAYLADVDSKQKHDLPMLERFGKVAGTDSNARKLYVEIVKANAELMEACEQNPEAAGERYNVRSHQLWQQLNGQFGTPQKAISATDMAALFLIGSDPAIAKYIPENVNGFNPVSNMLWQPQFQSSLGSGAEAAPFRKLFFAWADLRGNDVNTTNQVLSVIQNKALKEGGVEYAVRIMRAKDHQIWVRAQAMVTLSRIGGKEQVADFEALFDDKTLVTNIQWQTVMLNTQVGDIALAQAAHLSGQQPKDYGFDALQSQPSLITAYHYLGFSSDEKRAAAFKKWKEWSAAQKK